jgi:molybdate transport system substrate-binding protein
MKKSLVILGLVAGVWLGRALAAGEVAVLSAGAVEPGLKAAAAAFEKQTRHVVKITFNTVPQVRTRIDGGERADVVIATPAVLDEFAKAGKIEKERAALGRIGMGVAVRTGAAGPDIGSGDAFKRSMLAVDALVFSRGSSGIYFEGLLKKMGIADQIQGKVVRYDEGASVFEHVLKGKGNDVGVGQIT